jgi:hypothetical protein
MAKLIEIGQAQDSPAHMVIRAGDVLLFKAGGGLIRVGADVLEMLGPFHPATIVRDGTPLSPEGPPSTVMFVARAPGAAIIEVISGDLWHKPVRTVVNVVVEATGRR